MNRAKLLLWIVFVMLTGLDVILLLSQLFHRDLQNALATSIRLLLTVGLLICLYRGHVWARIVTGLLMLAATIYCAVSAISLQSLILWLLLAPFAFALYVVGLSPSVRQFLSAQKVKPNHNAF